MLRSTHPRLTVNAQKNQVMKMTRQMLLGISATLLFSTLTAPAYSHGIQAEEGNAKLAAFDIVQAHIDASDNWLTFKMQVSKQAGESTPTPTGKLEGSEVFSYVWPTRIDSSAVGFESPRMKKSWRSRNSWRSEKVFFVNLHRPYL